MNFLHNTNDFANVVHLTANVTGLKLSHIEKDYYVFMLLKLIRSKNDEIMFKGGTSLSKGWGILPRFSEDIDLNLLPEVPSTDSHRAKFARAVYNSFVELGFDYDYSKVHSRKEYNTFEHPYNAIFKDNYLNDYIKVETMANKKGKILNATYTPLQISNYIWDALSSNPKVRQALIKYGLEPFTINTQNMDVTFVEKVMSLTNRYIKGESFRLSRHLYDIYYMWTYGNLSTFDLRKTMTQTKQHLLERTNDICLRQDRPAYQILIEALASDFYMDDFNNITMGMKFNANDGVTYEMCKHTLLSITNIIIPF